MCLRIRLEQKPASQPINSGHVRASVRGTEANFGTDSLGASPHFIGDCWGALVLPMASFNVAFVWKKIFAGF